MSTCKEQYTYMTQYYIIFVALQELLEPSKLHAILCVYALFFHEKRVHHTDLVQLHIFPCKEIEAQRSSLIFQKLLKKKPGYKLHRSICPTLCCIAAVPNLFGTRDRFCGRQFFHGPVNGRIGSGGNVSDGEQQMELLSLPRCSPPAMWPGS